MQGQTSSYVITSLVAAPASALLTTLDTVKDELSIEDDDDSNDSRLTRMITEESAAIARHCNRIFGIATWRDEFRPQRGVRGEGVRGANNPLQLTKWPLASTAMSFVGNTHLSALVDGITSTTGLAKGMPVFGAGIPAGTTISSVMPFSVLLSAPATVAAVGVTLTTGVYIVETVAGVDTVLVPGTDYQIDAGSLLPGDEGQACLYRLNDLGHPRTWPATKITVTYQAGYALPSDDPNCQVSNLPPDLQAVCIRLVVSRFKNKDRDPMVRAEDQPGLGRTEYWVGAAPGQVGPYPNDIMASLDRYRVPVLA